MSSNTEVSVGIDSGGTFTDCFTADGQLVKVASTPDAPDKAVLAALNRITGSKTIIAHGTTVATNAVLQRKGARVALVSTRGFRDVIEIRRQNRPDIYDLHARWPDPLVPPELRFEMNERLNFDGSVLVEPDDSDVAALVEAVLRSGAEAVAIALLFSFVNPAHEQRFEREVARANADIHVSISSDVLPESGEYERTSATTLNAYVAPVIVEYLSRLSATMLSGDSDLYVMNSNGGLVDVGVARHRPLLTMVSGPAAGVVGAVSVSSSCGYENVVTMDVGGTSTDVAVVPGRLLETVQASVAGLPIGVSMLDIETVGAGGGSIAYTDDAGMLHVGPKSAGAVPGPACYGIGDQFTLTDANLILGRIPSNLLGGGLPLNEQAAKTAAESLGQGLGMTAREAALAVVRVACSNIQRAIRKVSLERGYDPRRFALVAFGGAGPQHAAEVAEGMGISEVLVPGFPGVMAAYGLLVAPRRRDYSIGTVIPAGAELDDIDLAFTPLYDLAASELGGISSMSIERFVDVRYQGQAFPLRLSVTDSILEDFHTAHAQRYGYSRAEVTAEIVTLRLCVSVEHSKSVKPLSRDFTSQKVYCPGRREVVFGSPFAVFDTPVYNRHRCGAGSEVVGPAIFEQYDTTVVVPPGWTALGLQEDNLLLVRR